MKVAVVALPIIGASSLRSKYIFLEDRLKDTNILTSPVMEPDPNLWILQSLLHWAGSHEVSVVKPPEFSVGEALIKIRWTVTHSRFAQALILCRAFSDMLHHTTQLMSTTFFPLRVWPLRCDCLRPFNAIVIMTQVTYGVCRRFHVFPLAAQIKKPKPVGTGELIGQDIASA